MQRQEQYSLSLSSTSKILVISSILCEIHHSSTMPKVSKRAMKSEAKISAEEYNDETIIMSSTTQTSAVRFSEEFAPGRFLVYSRFNDQDWIHIREYVT